MKTYQRVLQNYILHNLKQTPVIYINGPRQAGKSTLMSIIYSQFKTENSDISYFSFDDIATFSAAKNDPQGFIESLQLPVILDEIQLVPELFRSIKQKVDNLRQTQINFSYGQFFLTGSTNIMHLTNLSEALIGRMQIYNLFPLSTQEVLNSNFNLASDLFEHKPKSGKYFNQNNNIIELIRQATFPELTINYQLDNNIWFENYISQLIQREIRQMANISKLHILPQLIQIIANRVGSTYNNSDIAVKLGETAPITKRYSELLENAFLTFSIQPWFSNIEKRLVKSPKKYFIDTYLLSYILDINLDQFSKHNNQLFGIILENFVASELMKQVSLLKNLKLYHFRTHDNLLETDFILENQEGNIVAIEVKAKTTLTKKDFKNLDKLKELTNEKFTQGMILYQGDQIIPFGNNLFAIPIQTIWQGII